jgi:citrate synthase
MILQDKLTEIVPGWRERARRLVKEHGSVKVNDFTIDQVYGGMRDVEVLVTDISYVDPMTGIRFRGFTIPEVLEKLPKARGATMPYVGGLFYLLLVGEMPTAEQARAVEAEWRERAFVPAHVESVLRVMPDETHPMTLFAQAILALQTESQFVKRYNAGMKKDEYWIAALEDGMNLIAKLPALAAMIYCKKYSKCEMGQADPNLDWAGNFARRLGIASREYEDLARLYFIIHSDHESGNVSAHAVHLVGSALSDAYLAFAAGMNGLAGPLHGLANQECLGWLLSVYKRFNGVPMKEQLEQFANETLAAGKVIPGYGHAVLRTPDPRFVAQHEFGKRYFPNDDLFRLADLVYQVVPGVLKAQGKAKNPWPNVDAISGALQYHYGVREFDFYTVLFGVSRALGVTANLIWARALGQPIERPKSMTMAMLEEIAGKESN